MITIAGAVGFIVAGLALPIMISFAKPLIKFALFGNVVVTVIITSYGIVENIAMIVVLGIISFAILVLYAYSIWDRIPFAASNLITAATAVKKNPGLMLLSYISLLLLFGWSTVWMLIFSSALYVQGNCKGLDCQNETNYLLVLAFFFSYYWTVQVVKNVIHVTVSGTVAKWWFAPKDTSFICSLGIYKFWMQAMTYSFGSICFGSLLVSFIQTIKNVFASILEWKNGTLLCCCVDCGFRWIEYLAEYFNQWAFVFIGIYRYSYLEAGRNVMNLFRTRGWMTIITDSLLANTLLVMSLGVGVISGTVAVIASQIYQLHLGTFGPFFIGFLIGYALMR